MADDLVKRLRAVNAYKAPDFSIPFVEPIKAEAADRIEQLVATNETLERERDYLETNVSFLASLRDELAEDRDALLAGWDKSEARLAKAVEALRYYATCPIHEIRKVACAVLAEIEGKKDE